MTEYIKRFYSKYYEQWKGIYFDDRNRFCNLYELILNGLEEIPEDPYIYVKCAMNDTIRKDCETLDNIVKYFEGIKEMKISQIQERQV